MWAHESDLGVGLCWYQPLQSQSGTTDARPVVEKEHSVTDASAPQALKEFREQVILFLLPYYIIFIAFLGQKGTAHFTRHEHSGSPTFCNYHSYLNSSFTGCRCRSHQAQRIDRRSKTTCKKPDLCNSLVEFCFLARTCPSLCLKTSWWSIPSECSK